MSLKTPAFWYNEKKHWLAIALSPLAAIYQIGARLHQSTKTPQSVDIPIICIGNLTAGGSGKTPTAIALMRLIKDHNIAKNPMFLSRGYGSSAKHPTLVNPNTHTYQDIGDEPLLLASHAPTIVCANRHDGANHAIQNGADMIIMDDGLYNYDLKHDLTIIVIDGMMGFGNEQTLPAGPLREPLTNGLKKADLFILIGDDKRSITQKLPAKTPLINVSLQASGTINWPNSECIAFCGLGYPEKFFTFLTEKQGIKLCKTIAFPDHHPYTRSDIQTLKSKGKPLLTTTKDLMRIPPDMRGDITDIPVELNFQAPETLLNALKAVQPS